MNAVDITRSLGNLVFRYNMVVNWERQCSIKFFLEFPWEIVLPDCGTNYCKNDQFKED